MTFAPLGEMAVVVTVGPVADEATTVRIRSLAAALERVSAGIADVVPAYGTVTVFYDVGAFHVGDASPYENVCRLIQEQAKKVENSWPDLATAAGKSAAGGGELEVPVCYGGVFGPDLADVARHSGLTPAQVAELHSRGDYVVHAVGFTPGFPYLGGLPEKLWTPRRATPRTQVPAGSVGIGWKQTGIYSVESPGGWQLIGRTPLRLFDAQRSPAAMLRAGNRVKFKAISEEEFARWK